jgi:hypothetical protein
MAQETMMTDPRKVHESEAGRAGEARRSANQVPRQDRDRWDHFDLDEVRKTRADAPPPETPDDPAD